MEKLKHNHLFTDVIKVGIFALLLILPILCFIPTGFYYGFNEHAEAQTKEVIKDTETTTTNATYYENGTTKPTDNTEIEINKMYVWDSRKVSSYPMTGTLLCDYLEIIDSNNATITNEITDQQVIYLLTLSVYNGEQRYTINPNNGYIVIAFMAKQAPNFNNYYQGVDILNFHILQNTTQTTTTTTETETYNMSISESMYQAWEDVWTSPLFNWTNNTPLNTGLTGFVNIFGITTNSYISSYIIYLLSITGIYVVIDIVLEVFKWLTHLIGNK